MAQEVEQYKQPVPRSRLTFVPGDIVYEHLLKTNPKKLKRLIAQEQTRYAETHAPGYEERYRQELEEYRQEKAQWKKQTSDYQLLGLDSIEAPITKRVVTNAYRRAARKLHPDAGGTNDAFKQLHDVYRRVLAAVPAER